MNKPLLNLKKIKARNLQDGDIFYCIIDDVNEHLLGDNSDLTGIDVIYIADEVSKKRESVDVLVNGGHKIWFYNDDTVYLLGHYTQICDLFNSDAAIDNLIKTISTN